jgi:hypothetical protein
MHELLSSGIGNNAPGMFCGVGIVVPGARNGADRSSLGVAQWLAGRRARSLL